jgi:Tat protein translocase TatC
VTAEEQEAEGDVEGTRMSLTDHLGELRGRLFKGVIAVAVCFFACFAVYEQLARVVMGPYHRAKALYDTAEAERVEEKLAADPGLERAEFFGPDGALLTSLPPLHMIGVAEGFLFALRTCFYAALFLGGPVLLWQLWSFVSAGLYRHERRAALRYFPWSVLLFVSGAVFGYFLMVPYAIFFLTTAFTPDIVAPTITIENYFVFLRSLTLALGAVFQIPVLMVFFARIGVAEPAFYARYRGHFVIGAFVVSALITPPDPVTQLMMGLPMVLLFEVGLVCSRMFARPRSLPGSEPAGTGDAA